MGGGASCLRGDRKVQPEEEEEEKGEGSLKKPKHVPSSLASVFDSSQMGNHKLGSMTTIPKSTSSMSMVATSYRVARLKATMRARKPKKLQYQDEGSPKRSKSGQRDSLVHMVAQGRMMEMQRTMKEGLDDNDRIIYLPRGGTYVHTKAGNIQFGIPPESIKDIMQMGLDLPTHYVLPNHRFSLDKGLSMAEFEFPAYFNFFIKRRKIILICQKAVEPLIRTVFTETLLGPQSLEWPERFSDDVPRSAYPDLLKELSYFRKNPFNRSEDLSVDALLSFVHFENNVATIELDGVKVEVKDEGEVFAVVEDGMVVCKTLTEVFPNDIGANSEDEMSDTTEYHVRSPTHLQDSFSLSPTAPSNEDHVFGHTPRGHSVSYFEPPYFGVTMLGNSDGFDAKGSTTGFVLWLNQRGIMVDPPPYSGAVLKRHGIHPRLINGMIVTHCHADHDAGAFQKILEAGRVTLYTTRVICNSFLRKYSALSGVASDFLQKLFHFCPCVVGEKIFVKGGYLKFFYSLHTIPCVGFEAHHNGKSMIYSGDTLNDPVAIRQMHKDGFLSQGRRDKLLNFPFDKHDVILHESGVPPVHTPLSTFEPLSPEIKEKLYIVHKNSTTIPPPLKSALVGPKNTITISNIKPPNFDASECLELMCNIEIFKTIPIQRATELVQSAQVQELCDGQVLWKKGDPSDHFYVIALGVVAILDPKTQAPLRTFTTGDSLGAQGMALGTKREAMVRAMTHCKILKLDKASFDFLTRGTDIKEQIAKLSNAQLSKAWAVMQENRVLDDLTPAAKASLLTVLEHKSYPKGHVLWAPGDLSDFAILIKEGNCVFAEATGMLPFSRGAFVCETQALLRNSTTRTTLLCTTKVEVYMIKKASLHAFLLENPGLLIRIVAAHFVE